MSDYLKIITDFIYKRFNVGFKQRGYHHPNAEPGRFMSKEKPVRIKLLISFLQYLRLAFYFS